MLTKRHLPAVVIVLLLLFLPYGLHADPGKVNVNTASKAQLKLLYGVGDKLADRIIASRPFKATADLERVKGIGPQWLKVNDPYLTVTGETSLTGKVHRPANTSESAH